jgi:putative DNA primase/helicase
MTARLRSWAQALGGTVSGSGVICPGPGHSTRDRSLSVTPSAASPDGFVVYSHSGDDWSTCRNHVRARLGLPVFSPARPAGGHQRYRGSGTPAKAPESPSDTRALAMAIWSESRDPRGTLIEVYLGSSRRLELPDEAANEAIRFHPACPFGSERFPAMICLVRNIVTNEPQGIHRTALMPGGTAVKRNGKTFRLSLGSTSGGAIKLDPDEDVTQGICIGEGLETANEALAWTKAVMTKLGLTLNEAKTSVKDACLSGRLIGYRPIWSVLSTRGVARFPLLPGIDGLTIFGEYDEKQQSMEAIQSCAERWLAAGKEVLTAWPMAGNDLNDELRRRHVH